MLAGLLPCFGPLFSASFAPGWAPLQPGGGDANGAEQQAADGQPQAVLAVANSDVTQLRAELEAASFCSAVPPRIAVRLLGVVAAAAALKFAGSGPERLARLHKVRAEQCAALLCEHRVQQLAHIARCMCCVLCAVRRLVTLPSTWAATAWTCWHAWRRRRPPQRPAGCSCACRALRLAARAGRCSPSTTST